VSSGSGYEQFAAMTCPASDECTGVYDDNEVTFDPQSLSNETPVDVDDGQSLKANRPGSRSTSTSHLLTCVRT
jgi:hypothetical protein